MSRRSGSPVDPRRGPVRHGRKETLEERADRRWTELLQEVRVAQTGAQILFGFLLSVAFQPRFSTLGAFDHGLYVFAVVVGTLALGTLIAPVSFHRLLSGHRLKPELVNAARRLVSAGVGLLGLTVGSALLLLLRVVVRADLAWALTGGVMGWFAVCWLLLPTALLRRHERRQRQSPPGGARR